MIPCAPALRVAFDRERLHEKAECFNAESQPYIRRMCDLKLLFTTPFMVVKDGVVVESGERWNDPASKALYDLYEQQLRRLHASIFGYTLEEQK